MVDQGGEGEREESQIGVMNGKEVKAVGETERRNMVECWSNLRLSHLIMVGEVCLEVAVGRMLDIWLPTIHGQLKRSQGYILHLYCLLAFLID